MSRSDVESLYAYTQCGIDVSKVTDIYIYIYIYELLKNKSVANASCIHRQ